MNRQQAKEEIQRAMRRGGEFCNNIVGSILRQLATDAGEPEADSLCKELELGKRLGIMTAEEAKAEREKRRVR